MDRVQQTPLSNYQSTTVDAYRCSSAFWVTDDLLLTYNEREYDVNNNHIPIPPSHEGLRFYSTVPEDTLEIYNESRFYKAGHIQFGRDVFTDHGVYIRLRDRNEIGIISQLIFQGKFACHQLEDETSEFLYEVVDEQYFGSADNIYMQVLALSVGIIHSSTPTASSIFAIERIVEWWEWERPEWDCGIQDTEWYCSDEVIERNLAREMARDPRDEEHIQKWLFIKTRKAHSWIAQEET
ncbi:hypothetical protein VHEMI08169 [[Torrubiella] hemipterigena]|uniref:Uncharacterized protein n=1 Tax=[Torrubiella] hemipterigena TaxID=1531966 RepID=A0A0A1TMQ2_9HYPO|nr:hypothetical protein VHEMI08169 [[Torrubiella] hemipterigena]